MFAATYAQVVAAALQGSAGDPNSAQILAAVTGGAKGANLAASGLCEDFTDEQIESAFRFLDLDHNNYIGEYSLPFTISIIGDQPSCKQ